MKRAHGEAGPLEDHRERQGAFTHTRGDLAEMPHQETRLAVVWMARLSTKADFSRDYLLPMPSGNLKGCLHRELRYDTAFALHRRVMDVLASGQEKLFTRGVGHLRTLHSGRNFLPSAASALIVEQSDRDMLGGLMAQESDRYNRVAKVRIQVV